MTIFKNKKLAIIICACAAVLLALVCWLFTLIVQKNSFDKQVEELKEQIAEGDELIERYKTEQAYRETVDYIIEWAEQEGMLTQDELNWINENLKDD